MNNKKFELANLVKLFEASDKKKLEVTFDNKALGKVIEGYKIEIFVIQEYLKRWLNLNLTQTEIKKILEQIFVVKQNIEPLVTQSFLTFQEMLELCQQYKMLYSFWEKLLEIRLLEIAL